MDELHVSSRVRLVVVRYFGSNLAQHHHENDEDDNGHVEDVFAEVHQANAK